MALKHPNEGSLGSLYPLGPLNPCVASPEIRTVIGAIAEARL